MVEENAHVVAAEAQILRDCVVEGVKITASNASRIAINGESKHCRNCGAELIGEYCHACGQRRVSGRMTTRSFLKEVVQRVLRIDKAFAITAWRLLRSPGELVEDYLLGKRAGILDPLTFYVSSVFAQIVIAAVTRRVAPMIERESAISWIDHLGGMVAIKIGLVLWGGALWRTMFRSRETNLGEIYTFATYAVGATGLLWAMLPVADLALPVVLARNEESVAAVTLGIEILYLSYAVKSWMKYSFRNALIGVSSVLIVGYGILAAVVGLDEAVSFAPLAILLR